MLPDTGDSYLPAARPTLIARVPFERVPRPVQDLSAPSAYRHDRRHDSGIESVRHESREELTIDCDNAHLRVVTAEVDSVCSDQGFQAGHRLLRAGGKGDKSLRTEAETGESETIHGKGIARNIVPFGVCLKRRLTPLDNRWWQTPFSTWGTGRSQSARDENRTSEAQREEEQETISVHEHVVCYGSGLTKYGTACDASSVQSNSVANYCASWQALGRRPIAQERGAQEVRAS
jgi:hypothetical protein